MIKKDRLDFKDLISEEKTFILVIILGAIKSLLTVTFAYLIGIIIDSIGKSSYEMLKKVGIYILVAVALYFLISFLYNTTASKLVYRQSVGVKNKIFKRLDDFDLVEYSSMDKSYYINMLTEDVNIISKDYFRIRHEVYVQVISFIISLIAIIYISWSMTLIFLGIILITMLIPNFLSPIQQRKTEDFSLRSKENFSNLNEYLQGFFVYKGLGLEGPLDSMKENDEKFEKSRMDMNFTNDMVIDTIEVVSILGQVGCMFVGAFFAIKGTITTGALIAAVQLLNGIFTPVQTISIYNNRIRASSALREKVTNLLSIIEPVKEKFTSLNRGISLNSYSLDLGHKEIIKNFTYTFEKGLSYIIIGPSGSGKSSLMKAILGYYNSNDKKIKYDNLDLEDIDKKDLYKNIRYVPSETFIFKGSVEDNICLGRDVDNSHLISEVYKLGFDEDFLRRRLSEENLVELSSGEQKRISILRATIDHPEVVIFDEPTANLDKKSSRYVKNYINNYKAKIKIVISHDYDDAYLNEFDRVIDFENKII